MESSPSEKEAVEALKSRSGLAFVVRGKAYRMQPRSLYALFLPGSTKGTKAAFHPSHREKGSLDILLGRALPSLHHHNHHPLKHPNLNLVSKLELLSSSF